MKRVVCIIPARLGSYRFPTKPFVDICGKSMLEHVYKRAQLCELLDEVYVATPNQEIVDHVEAFGGKALMTSDDVRRASDRVAQAAEMIESADIIVNLQGDEPLVFPDMIAKAIQPLLDDPTLSCVNLAKRVSYEEAKNIHEVKVVFDENDEAMYFSREPIPSKFMGDKDFPYFIEVCVFPFTSKSLKEFTNLPSTKLEEIESIDMLRFLEHGHRIKIVETDYETYSIDMPEDVDVVRKVMEKDALRHQY
jgi:3-deoxy-manno-octulosonate cytidylyltransferase (CMP-KDO synthetase)